MRIGELARRSGVSERSLLFYEQQGLLLSARTTGELVEELTVERDRIDRMILDLVRSRDALDEVIDAATIKA